MNFQDYFKSKYFKPTLYIIGGLAVLLLVFQAGMFVGFRKASFSFGWGENYYRNFGGPRQGFFRDVRGDDLISGHGIAGTIIKIDSKSIIMKDGAGVERIVNTNDQTDIRNGRDQVILKDLRADDRIVVLGNPEQDGSITAKMIRIFNSNQPMPFPPMMNGAPINNGTGQLPPPINIPKLDQPFINQIK